MCCNHNICWASDLILSQLHSTGQPKHRFYHTGFGASARALCLQCSKHSRHYGVVLAVSQLQDGVHLDTCGFTAAAAGRLLGTWLYLDGEAKPIGSVHEQLLSFPQHILDVLLAPLLHAGRHPLLVRHKLQPLGDRTETQQIVAFSTNDVKPASHIVCCQGVHMWTGTAKRHLP